MSFAVWKVRRLRPAILHGGFLARFVIEAGGESCPVAPAPKERRYFSTRDEAERAAKKLNDEAVGLLRAARPPKR